VYRMTTPHCRDRPRGGMDYAGMIGGQGSQKQNFNVHPTRRQQGIHQHFNRVDSPSNNRRTREQQQPTKNNTAHIEAARTKRWWSPSPQVFMTSALAGTLTAPGTCRYSPHGPPGSIAHNSSSPSLSPPFPSLHPRPRPAVVLTPSGLGVLLALPVHGRTRLSESISSPRAVSFRKQMKTTRRNEQRWTGPW